MNNRTIGKVHKADTSKGTGPLGTDEIGEFDSWINTISLIMHFHDAQYQVQERTDVEWMPYELNWKD